MPVKKGGTMIRGNDNLRFDSKVVQVGDCHEWQGCLSHNGYGKFMTKADGQRQRTWVAHRWNYQRVHGHVPPLLRHKCDNPRCVRVDHLEPGTQRDNVHDAMMRGRRVVAMTEVLVRELRAVRAAGGSIRAAAARLGVKYMTAYQVATEKTWRHIL
jgi:hypothetical protein